MAGIDVRSSAFTDHTPIPGEYSRASGDVFSRLEWLGVPEGAAELALICEDPDAPMGTFTHWLLANVSPSDSGIPEGRPPETAVAGSNDFGDAGYGGPHPPAGDEPHRYCFRVYALRQPLDMPPGFTVDQLRNAMDDRTLDSGHLVGTYAR